jgi:hypothetical protein
MVNSLQTGWSIARSFGSVGIIATAAASFLVGDFAHSDTPPSVEAAGDARAAKPGQCETVALAQVPGLTRGGFVQCTRREGGMVCEACPTCGSPAGCTPVRTRGIGPRSPGGGPDD